MPPRVTVTGAEVPPIAGTMAPHRRVRRAPSHPVFASLTEDEAHADLRNNQKSLRSLALSRARLSDVFAMPFGSIGTYTERTLRILAEEGHSQVLLTMPLDLRFVRTTAVACVTRVAPPPTLAGLQEMLRAPARTAPGR